MIDQATIAFNFGIVFLVIACIEMDKISAAIASRTIKIVPPKIGRRDNCADIKE